MLKSFVAASVLGVACLGPFPAVLAQGQGSLTPAEQPARSPDTQEFLTAAYSSAMLQGQASTLAASRETRPEVKEFAAGMAEFRASLLRNLQAFAQERGLRTPATKEFEHQVVLENLEPLEYLALSRRYAEIQVQALVQEIRLYQIVAESGPEDVRAFAAQVLPSLQQHHAQALKVYEAVGP